MANTENTTPSFQAPQTFTTPTLPGVSLRVLLDAEGQPWFVARDVALALGYALPPKAILYHCKYAKILKGSDSELLTSSPRGLSIIPESDVYRLIMRSKLPDAAHFQDWVVEEVLPSLRKTGRYSLIPDDPTSLGLPDFRNPVEAAKAWALAIEEKQEVEGRLAIAEPKAAVYDEVVAPNILTLTDFCRRLEGVNIMAVKRSLCVASVFYVAPDGGYRVYARYRDTHFAEKFDKDYGSRTFHVLPEGQKLLTRLYHEGKLIMKKGFTAPSRDKGVSHAA